MSGIIKTLKTKTDDIEQNVYPKTVLEAVVDSETNETLDNIIDELNNKIDNIEISGGTPVENLLVYPYAISSETTDNYTIVDNKDGTLTISCNFPELSAANVQIVSKQPISAGTYTVSGCSENFTDSTVNINVYVDDTSGNRIHYGSVNYGQNFIFTVTELCYLSLNLSFNLGASLTDAVLKPMLELGTVAHDYRPYKDVSKANQTDIDNKVSKSGDTMTGALNIQSPNFSVLNLTRTGTSSGGNYTGIQFNNDSGMLGGLAMNTTSGDMNVVNKDGVAYPLLDTRNYKNYKHDSLSYLKSTSNTDVGVEDTSSNAIGYVKVPSLYNQTDGALYKQVYSDQWVHEIYGDYRTGQIAVRGKNNGTWQSWRGVLDSSNYSSYALPLTGGTVTGATTFNSNLVAKSEGTKFEQDYYVHNFASGSGSTGYWKFATIKTNNTYIGGVLKFTIHQRDKYGDVNIYFNGNSSEAGANISTIKQTGSLSQVYYVKTATQTFDLYLKKPQSYDNATVTRIDTSKYIKDRTTITWTDTYVASLPTGATAATVTNDWSGIIKSASTSISLSLRKGFNYIIFATGSSGMSFTETIIYIPYTDTFHGINTDASGSATSAISGTTYTLTFSGSGSSRLEYIEIGG